jgi:Uma2 family endonuclease
MMSPAPEIAHQAVIVRISRYLDEQIFSTQRGWVFMAPTDVVLSPQKVVQPDVLVLLREHKDRLKKRCIEGAPDLVVEVISPSSAAYDRLVKHNLYAESGVPEYWLVNLQDQSIEVFVLEGKQYHSPGLFRNEQPIKSLLIPGETLQASLFFNWEWEIK